MQCVASIIGIFLKIDVVTCTWTSFVVVAFVVVSVVIVSSLVSMLKLSYEQVYYQLQLSECSAMI